MTKPPILFLDYDGVIIDAGSRIVTGSRTGMNMTSVGLIKRLQDNFGLLIVCSSRAHAHDTWSKQAFPLTVNSADLTFYRDDTHPTSWRTSRGRSVPKQPGEVKYESRGNYVKDWLLTHGYDWVEDPYIMLDDDDDFYPLDDSRYYLVPGSEARGGFNFTDYLAVYNKLAAMLGKPDGY